MKLDRIGWSDKFSVGAFGCQSKERVNLVRTAYQQAETLAGKRFSMNDVFLIGDSPYDIFAAHQAGIRSIGIASGNYSLDELSQNGADESYPNLKAWRTTLC